jgi:pantetheine-phosphate adenylyltransferase
VVLLGSRLDVLNLIHYFFGNRYLSISMRYATRVGPVYKPMLVTPMPCFDKAVLGGTFDFLHKGHRDLLITAFKVAAKVTIGLTTDEFAMSRKEITHNYNERKAALTSFLESQGFSGRYEILPISDPVGPATGDFDAIVVSEETLPGAQLVNEARTKAGTRKLIVIVVPMALAYDKKPISSARIRRGEINEEGSRVELRKGQGHTQSHRQFERV